MEKAKLKEDRNELIRYFLAGTSGNIICYFIYYFLRKRVLYHDSQFDIQLANLISFVINVVFCYRLNRKWVFKIEENNSGKEFIGYLSSQTIAYLFEVFLMFLLPSVLKINDKIAKIITLAFIGITNYLVSKFIVFRKAKN